MKFKEITYRDCGNCGVRDVSMSLMASYAKIVAADGNHTSWAVLACPRCAALTVIELFVPGSGGWTPDSGIPLISDVTELRVLPEDMDSKYKVDHLPESVKLYLETSVRVLQAGVPDAAAVQLRRTLEAAVAQKGLLDQNKPLVRSIERLIDDGFVTKDFAEALTHVRKVGNQGAHYTDERLSEDDVKRALLFTVQFLRNLFEVPGELARITETPPGDE